MTPAAGIPISASRFLRALLPTLASLFRTRRQAGFASMSLRRIVFRAGLRLVPRPPGQRERMAAGQRFVL